MALDFFILGTEEFLFSLKTKSFFDLEKEIFIPFKYRTGILIDEYRDNQLSIENQQILIEIIDEYVEKTNLNTNKMKTKNILGFRGLLLYSIEKKYNLKLVGD